jgi:hypothetical protein
MGNIDFVMVEVARVVWVAGRRPEEENRSDPPMGRSWQPCDIVEVWVHKTEGQVAPSLRPRRIADERSSRAGIDRVANPSTARTGVAGIAKVEGVVRTAGIGAELALLVKDGQSKRRIDALLLDRGPRSPSIVFLSGGATALAQDFDKPCLAEPGRYANDCGLIVNSHCCCYLPRR